MHLDIKCQNSFFDLIKNGKKKIEGRLGKEKYLQLKPGDTICFNNELNCEVVAIRKYLSFCDMLNNEGLHNVLPGMTGDQLSHMVYRDFYSEEDEKNYGVVAIEIKL